MGVDTSGVDQFRQVVREMERGGDGAAALQEILQNRQDGGAVAQEILRKRGGGAEVLQKSTDGGRVMSLEDGTGSAASARVNGDNNLGTEARYGRTSACVNDARPLRSCYRRDLAMSSIR